MKNKVLIGTIIVLIGVIVAEGVYLFTNKEEGEENNSYINIPKEEEEENGSNDNETSEDYVKLVNTREEDNQVIQEYEMVLNGEYQEFDITFEINEGEGYWDISSEIGENNIFSISNSYEEMQLPNNFADYIFQYFNENNFIIFPGIDGKNYLILQSYATFPDSSVQINYDIFNQNWNYIGYLPVVWGANAIVLEDESVWYPNNLYIDDLKNEKHIRCKIVDNSLYNLVYQVEYVEERVYTVSNNQLEYNVINQYKVIEANGQAY